jgi:hypothetical protein
MHIPALYQSLVIWISDGTGLSDSLLHIHAGMIVFSFARLVSRKGLGTFIPFAFVGGAELGNETLDFLGHGMRWGDTLSDIANTLFWPLVVTVVVRLRPVSERSKSLDVAFNLHDGEVPRQAAPKG